MKFPLYPILIALVFIILGAAAFFSYSSSPEEPTPTPKEEKTETQDTETSKEETPEQEPTSQTGYTMTEVETHNSESSCWSVIRGNVYDLTEWIGKHPGGAKSILRICGSDGTSAFEGKHGGDEKPEAALTSFLLGPLVN